MRGIFSGITDLLRGCVHELHFRCHKSGTLGRLRVDNYRAAHRSRRDVFNNWLRSLGNERLSLRPGPRPGWGRGVRRARSLCSPCDRQGDPTPYLLGLFPSDTGPGCVTYAISTFLAFSITYALGIRLGAPWCMCVDTLFYV